MQSFPMCVCVCVCVGGGRGYPPSHDFFETPPPPHQNWCPSHGAPTPHWKVKPLSRKRYLEKRPKKLETVIDTCVSFIKRHWKKLANISQKRDFLTLRIQNVIRKVKQFVRKYYTTWLNDLANKLYDVEKFLDSILCYVLLKIVLFC